MTDTTETMTVKQLIEALKAMPADATVIRKNGMAYAGVQGVKNLPNGRMGDQTPAVMLE